MPLLLLALALAARASDSSDQVKDFDQFWTFVADRYPYLSDITTDWDAVHAALAPQAAAASSRDAFVAVLEDALDQLYDPHCMLNTNTDASWRPVPHGVWAEWRDGRAVVTAVQGGSAAETAGIVPGDEVLRVDGEDVRTVTDQRRPRFLRTPDPAADAWALLTAVAGRHGDHTLQVLHANGETADLALSTSADPPGLAWDQLTPTVGRIEIHSFGDHDLVAQFDAALEALVVADGLVIDLRSNSGGSTTVALPMIGRLLDQRAQYAWMTRRKGDAMSEPWPEFVNPRGRTVDVPVVVVVDRFTVSMGEGFAMAIQDTGRGRIVGTQMGGLEAGIVRVKLRNTGISAQISAEPVSAVDHTPRSDLVPDVVVDPTVPTSGDPFLAAALATLTGS